MPVIDVHTSQVAVATTAVPTAAPGGGTAGIQVGEGVLVRTFLDYAGTVNSCALTIWFRDRETGVWYEGATTDDLDPLTPGGAAPVDEVRDWEPGGGQEIFFQVAAISGGGTVAVRVQGVRQ